MGGTQRVAAVAAVHHARHYFNHTQPEVQRNSDAAHYNVNIFFVSATLCGVIVAVCAVCWRRSPAGDKPEDELPAGVYTVSQDQRLHQVQEDLPAPPPAYDSLVHDPAIMKEEGYLQEVVIDPCSRCQGTSSQADAELPSYEAAVLLRDTKL